MSGGFYLNGREVSDGGPSTSREASARDPLFALKANIADASRENNFEACLGYSDEGLRLSPGSKEFLLMKAKFLVLMHQSDKANELLSEILKLDTQNAEAIATLGLIFYHQGNLNKSIEVFNNALEIDSSLTETKILRDKAMRITRIMQNSESVQRLFHSLAYVFPFSSRCVEPKGKFHDFGGKNDSRGPPHRSIEQRSDQTASIPSRARALQERAIQRGCRSL